MKISSKLACGFFSYIAMNTIAVVIECTDQSQLSAVLKQSELANSSHHFLTVNYYSIQSNTL